MSGGDSVRSGGSSFPVSPPLSPLSPASDRSSVPSLQRGYSKDFKVFDVKKMVAQLHEQPKAGERATVVDNAEAVRNEPGRPIIVRISKPTLESGLGLLMDTTPGAGILICGHIPGGPIGKHNKKAETEAQIKPGDHMLRVNGIRGDVERMMEEIHTDTSVEVEVWRPKVWTAVLTKRSPSESLGLKLRYMTESRFPVIWGLSQGAVERYNKEHPKQAIRPKDRILSVNGTSGEPSILTCLMFGGKNTVSLCLIRSTSEESEQMSRETTSATAVRLESTDAVDAADAADVVDAEGGDSRKQSALC